MHLFDIFPKFEFKHYLFSTFIICLAFATPIIANNVSWQPIQLLLVHSPLIMALFVCPGTAVCACLASTLSFFYLGAKPIILIRSLSHMVYLLLGAYTLWIMRRNTHSSFNWLSFALIINGIHAVILATVLYLESQLPDLQAHHSNWSQIILTNIIPCYIYGTLLCIVTYFAGRYINQRFNYPYFRLIF